MRVHRRVSGVRRDPDCLRAQGLGDCVLRVILANHLNGMRRAEGVELQSCRAMEFEEACVHVPLWPDLVEYDHLAHLQKRTRSAELKRPLSSSRVSRSLCEDERGQGQTENSSRNQSSLLVQPETASEREGSAKEQVSDHKTSSLIPPFHRDKVPEPHVPVGENAGQR